MIDERTMQLINGAIDEVLSSAERSELATRLEESEEARRYNLEMQKLNDVLTDLPQQELDPGLHQQIVDSMRVPKTAGSGAKHGFHHVPAVVRYGLAMAAGVLLAIGQYEIAGYDPRHQDLSQLVGTMAAGDGPSDSLDTLSLDAPDLSGTVRLDERRGKTILDLKLESTAATDVLIDLTATSLRFDALAQDHTEFESIRIADRMIRIRSSGRQHFTVLLHRSSDNKRDDTEVVELRFSRDGALIQHGGLSPQ